MICLVCYGLVQDWMSFPWILVTFVPLVISAIHTINGKKGSERVESKKFQSVKAKAVTICIFVLKGVVMLIAALLASGGIVAAIASSYPASGYPVSVFFDGSARNGSLQVYCIGTTNASQPTTFIFTSAAHGIVDLYGLQYYLSSLNGTDRRVCTHDPLGFGWSQDPFSGQFTNYEYLYRLMLATGEPAPWNIVGWGGGGSAITYLAGKYSSSIKSVTFVETYPPGIEFSYYGHQNGLNQQAVSDYRGAQLSSRIGFSQLILWMAIPWGLMSLFVPLSPRDTNYYPPERWPEFRVQMWKSKVWISQYQGIQHMQVTPDSTDSLVALVPLPPSIPVFGVYCNVTATCFDGFQNRTGQACLDKINENGYYNDRKFALVLSVNPNASIITNTEYDCGLSLPVQKPMFTAASILSLFKTIDG
ncbi:hypothetical protein BKA69DRAFT_1063994 [Paraphysoderma sedebokerense]|nr:hypothetical protein BKA69DRAFT_1063994 [Paraphysoderma sedebokerense]